MKKFRKNEKGFTLIELLAVIVILAILIAVAIPATMRYLASSRKDTFATNAAQALTAVREDVAFSGPNKDSIYYSLEDINKLLDKKLITSSYGSDYDDTSYVKATKTNGIYIFDICLVDEEGNGVSTSSGSEVSSDEVKTGVTCTTPTDSAKATVAEDGSRTRYGS